MKRALPLWILAIMPAALVGHALAYALTGRSMTDAHHAWVMPALECSFALLLTVCAFWVGGALLKAGILVHGAVERSYLQLWPRLAIAQLAFFATMERAEGTRTTLVGCAIQILVALFAAYLLALFAGLIERCAGSALAAGEYQRRLLDFAAFFVSRRPAHAAHALAVCAGTSRFQRPPPKP